IRPRGKNRRHTQGAVRAGPGRLAAAEYLPLPLGEGRGEGDLSSRHAMRYSRVRALRVTNARHPSAVFSTSVARLPSGMTVTERESKSNRSITWSFLPTNRTDARSPDVDDLGAAFQS